MRTAQRTRQVFPPRLLRVETLEERELLSHGANTVSGEAFGVFAQVGAIVDVPKTPDVVLPSSGGMDTDQVLCIGQHSPNPGCLFAGQTTAISDTLTVTTTGAIGAKNASAQSSATVQHLNVLSNLVTADLVVGFASCTGNGKTATTNAAGSTLINLSVNGVFIGDVTPAPNTTINVGLGTLTLNEQTPGGDGKHSTALTVNMVHVRLNDPLTGLLATEVIVSAAHCDVNFAPVTITGPKFMTGGGRLGTGRDIATFGFHAGKDNAGVLQGQLQYIDHKRGINIHSTAITSFSVIKDARGKDTTCVTATGTARVNGVDGYSFTVTSACDNGEPGIGKDTFSLSVMDPNGNSFYARSGALTGGNLQLHPL